MYGCRTDAFKNRLFESRELCFTVAEWCESQCNCNNNKLETNRTIYSEKLSVHNITIHYRSLGQSVYICTCFCFLCAAKAAQSFVWHCTLLRVRSLTAYKHNHSQANTHSHARHRSLCLIRKHDSDAILLSSPPTVLNIRWIFGTFCCVRFCIYRYSLESTHSRNTLTPAKCLCCYFEIVYKQILRKNRVKNVQSPITNWHSIRVIFDKTDHFPLAVHALQTDQSRGLLENRIKTIWLRSAARGVRANEMGQNMCQHLTQLTMSCDSCEGPNSTDALF